MEFTLTYSPKRSTLVLNQLKVFAARFTEVPKPVEVDWVEPLRLERYRRTSSGGKNISEPEFVTNGIQIDCHVNHDLTAQFIAANNFSDIERLVMAHRHLELIKRLDAARNRKREYAFSEY